jgi:poly-gamma-glutamate biosynthesis protein PgsC/CapC
VETALIVGLLIAILFHEIFGLSPGGLVVPGYLGFFLLQPRRVLVTLTFAILTMVVLRFLEERILLYGRRKFLVAVLVGALLPKAAVAVFGPTWLGLGSSIGFVIPGLIAQDMDTQGVGTTLLALFPAAIMVRLVVELCIRMGFL